MRTLRTIRDRLGRGGSSDDSGSSSGSSGGGPDAGRGAGAGAFDDRADSSGDTGSDDGGARFEIRTDSSAKDEESTSLQ